jgi:hypothetical protein
MTYSYVPGSCNLGKSEIRRRQFVALLGLFLAGSTLAFCLAYGFMGTFNLGKLGDLSRVQSPEDRKADRRTALKILIQSAALAFLLTVLLVAAPL